MERRVRSHSALPCGSLRVAAKLGSDLLLQIATVSAQPLVTGQQRSRSRVRPFVPMRFNSADAEHEFPRRPRALNAREIINPHATQTNRLPLCHGWLAPLNRSRSIALSGW
jgi:hypothetical protein